MKTSEIKELTTKELRERIEDEKALAVRLHLNHAVSPLESPIKLRHIRRNIARLVTEFRKRELSGKL